ncbi:MAG: pantetheine-phosphate adenylyltransferase [Flavobacteriaceae bacterium]|mgnify:FL=1|jgi:pantetheine-phosphate adenylyltransferase|tara:strand:- start:235 stop:687 length:453 start_codon:yes stop_codon:yes gene_type:complete
MKRAVFPGSFDPITLGHCDIINRGTQLFDELIIAIGENLSKNYLFSLEQRKAFIENIFSDNKKIKVFIYSGLTTDFCKKIKANYILRGLRNSSDFEYENSIAQTNKKTGEIETVFLLSSPEKSFISSSIVREIIKHNGKFEDLVPNSVKT